jgi:beta-glucosidase
MTDPVSLSRRSLLSSLGGGLVANLLPGCAATQASSAAPVAPGAVAPPPVKAGRASPFSSDFAWGTATAAYQIEGAADVDGRGPSVWDVFSRKPGATFEGQTGDVACDHYHRYPGDVALLAQLGARAYRFSISWTRVLPEGRGAVNEKGLDFYKRLLDELAAAQIEPYATVFHWDYPQALFLKGGWLNRDSADWFADYTSLLVSRLGDRIQYWFTQNEPNIYIGFGHALGLHAPGLKLPMVDVLLAAHNSLRAHGRAVQAIRANMPPGKSAQVGAAFAFLACHPHSNTPEDTAAAAEVAFRVDGKTLMNNAWWMDPVFRGSYPADGLRAHERELPAGFERDVSEVRQPLDFVGLNIYSSQACRRAPGGGAEVVPMPPGYPRAANDWQPLVPQALYYGPRFVHERYGVPVFITENGLSVRDQLYLDGAVHDAQRVDYLQRVLIRLADAVRDGVPVRGYFHWSFLDNFEWADGYKQRFGLVYVDFTDQRRIPKDSFAYYQKVIASNGALVLEPTAVDADRVTP